MKYRIILFIILFPVFATAQENAVRSLATAVLDSAMTSSLGIDSSSDEVNMKEYNQFKNLFDSNATVVDNFNVYFQFGTAGRGGYYKTDTVTKPFDVYAHDVALKNKKSFNRRLYCF